MGVATEEQCVRSRLVLLDHLAVTAQVAQQANAA